MAPTGIREGARLDSDDSDDRTDDLEQELVELKLRRHKASLLPDPGIKGWLIFFAIWLVSQLLIMGTFIINKVGSLEPSLRFKFLLLIFFFCYLLYVTVIFFQCKKSTRTHMKVILLLLVILDGVDLFSSPRLDSGLTLLFDSILLGYWHFSDRVAVTFGSSHIA